MQFDHNTSTDVAFQYGVVGTAHRAQASTHGVAKFAPIACAGPLLAGELNALEQALSDPARPLVAIVGGSKVSTKLPVLETLSDKVDQLVVGGGQGTADGIVGPARCEFGQQAVESARRRRWPAGKRWAT